MRLHIAFPNRFVLEIDSCDLSGPAAGFGGLAEEDLALNGGLGEAWLFEFALKPRLGVVEITQQEAANTAAPGRQKGRENVV